MKQNKMKRKISLKSNGGMTLVELLVALSLFMVVVFCFTPLFMAYYKNVKLSGDIVKTDYAKVGMIERLVGNSGFNQGYEYEVDQIPLKMTVKGTDKTMTAAINGESSTSNAGTVQDIAGNNIISTPDAAEGGFVTFYADSITSTMMCYPSHISDDFKTKTIQVYLSGSKFGTNVNTNMYLSSQSNGTKDISEDYYDIDTNTGSGSIVNLILYGGGDQICFNKSPIYLNYTKGKKSYQVKIEIDAPNIIMVGEKDSEGNYYYYVSSGEVNDDGTLDVVARTMDTAGVNGTNVALTSAMNDVEWVSAGEGDNGNGGTNEYGYYTMCGDNGQIRRFQRADNGSYYWGGDTVLDSSAISQNGTVTNGGQKANQTTANYTYVYQNQENTAQDTNNGTSKKGIKLQVASGASQLYTNTAFTLNATDKVSDLYFWAIDSDLLQTFKRTDNNGSWSTGSGHFDDVSYNRFIINNKRGLNTLLASKDAVIGLADGALSTEVSSSAIDLLTHKDNFNSDRFTVTKVNASDVTQYAGDSGTPAKNYVTLTSVGAVQMNSTYATTNNNPTNSYTLYCGYIPAVVDIWSPTRGWGDGNQADTTPDTISKWIATLGVAYNEDSAQVLINYPFIRERKWTETSWWVTHTYYVRLGANLWNYGDTNVKSYSLSGIVGPSNYEDSTSIKNAETLIAQMKANPTSYYIAQPEYIQMIYPLNQENYQQYLQKQNTTTVSIGYLSNLRAMGTYNKAISSACDNSMDVLEHASIYQWTYNEGTTILDVGSTQIEDSAGNVNNISMAVGYTLSGLEYGFDSGGDDWGASVPTVMNCGVVYLRSGGDGNENAYSGWTLEKESNIFHVFYAASSYYNNPMKNGTGAILNNTNSSAKYWRDPLHPLFYSLWGTQYNSADDGSGNKYQWIPGHITYDKKFNCVQWGTTWRSEPEVMWGASDGTLLEWYISSENSNKYSAGSDDDGTKNGNVGDQNVQAEFQSYRQVENAAQTDTLSYAYQYVLKNYVDIHLNKYTGNLANVIESSWNPPSVTSTNPFTGNKDNFIKENKAKDNAYLDARSNILADGKSSRTYMETYAFISPLDTIEDVAYANDVWVACGAQGQSTPTYCGPGALTKGDGDGSWIAVRTWLNLNPGVDKKQTDGNDYYTWHAVQISNEPNCNIQQVTYINGMWYAVGYYDKNNNNTYDDGEPAVMYYAKDPSIACSGKNAGDKSWNGGWALVKTSGQTENKYTQACKFNSGSWDVKEIGGINSMASRTD